MPFISIRTKLLTGVLVVILLLGGLLIIFINTTVPKKLEIELQKRAVILAEDIAYESIENLLTEPLGLPPKFRPGSNPLLYLPGLPEPFFLALLGILFFLIFSK